MPSKRLTCLAVLALASTQALAAFTMQIGGCANGSYSSNYGDTAILARNCLFDTKLGDGTTVTSTAAGTVGGSFSGTSIKLSAAVITSGFANMNAAADIQVNDSLTISVPNYSGGVWVAYSLALSGSTFVDFVTENGVLSAGGYFTYSAFLNDSTASHGQDLSFLLLQATNSAGAVPSSAINGKPGNPFAQHGLVSWVPANSPFLFKQRLHIEVASGGGYSRGTGVVNFDLGHSLYWGGISAVYSASGATIDNFSVSSASGADYLISHIPAAIPEPGTALLWALGLGTWPLMRRRRT